MRLEGANGEFMTLFPSCLKFSSQGLSTFRNKTLLFLNLSFCAFFLAPFGQL